MRYMKKKKSQLHLDICLMYNYSEPAIDHIWSTCKEASSKIAHHLLPYKNNIFYL